MGIDFQETNDVHRGTGHFGRQWLITRAFTGWRRSLLVQLEHGT